MSEQKKPLRQKIADRAKREPHEVIADAIRKAGQDIAAQLGESFGPLRKVRVVTDGEREAALALKATLDTLRGDPAPMVVRATADEMADPQKLREVIEQQYPRTFENREEKLRREIRDQVLELCGYVDGGEVTYDGSAGNDLAGERADAIMKIIDVVRGSNWPEGYVPLEMDAAPEKRLQAIRQHLIALCRDPGSEPGKYQQASERADVVMAVASLARTHPDPKRLLPRGDRLGDWLAPGTRVTLHLGKDGESEYSGVVEPTRDMVTLRLDGSGVVTDFPRNRISKEGEPWTPPKPTAS